LAYFICFIYLPCAASYGRSEAAFGIMWKLLNFTTTNTMKRVKS
jgi:hypothetical protein